MFPLAKALFFKKNDTPGSGVFNMACDEALLHLMTQPWLRLYDWKEITKSIGYFMPSSKEQNEEVPWVRRWTGGGMVLHGMPDETTFSIGVPYSSKMKMPSSRPYYREIHLRVQAVLTELGVACEMTGGEGFSQSDHHCFNNAVASDLINPANGRKIAGGALRRHRSGLLYQGSIQDKILPESFGSDLAHSLGADVKAVRIGDRVEQLAKNLAEEKYNSPKWKYSR